MKRKIAFLAAFLFAVSGVFVTSAPVSACIGADGKPVEGTDGAQTNCSPQQEKTEEHFSVESDSLDFGRITELGRSYTKEIKINNNTSKDVIIDASIDKYDGVADGNSKLAEWLVFVGGVSHFNVAANNSRSLSVRVLAPTEAVAGSQYAKIILTDANGYSTKVNVKLDIAGEGLKYASEVKDAWVDPVRLDKELNGRVTVKNTGTAGFTSTYQIKTKNILGGGDWVIIRETKEDVFPGNEVQFSAENEMGFGIFAIEQRVTFVNSEGRMVESLLSRTAVNLPWWSIAIAGGVIVLIIILIIARKHHKKKKNSDKMKKTEQKAHKAEVEKIEKAEEKAIEKEKEENGDEDEVAEEEIEEVPTLDDEEETADEIDKIAEKMEKVEDDASDDEEDNEYDEGEAIPIKVTIKKSPKK